MLVDPISLSGMCSVIAPRLLPRRCSVPHCPSRRTLPTASVPLSGCWATALRAVQSFFTGSRRPAFSGPRALAATGRRRSLSPPPLRRPPAAQRATPPMRTARAGSNSTVPSTRRRPKRPGDERAVPPPAVSHRKHEAEWSAVRTLTTPRQTGARSVTYSGSVAEARTGLLEAHVTGARSAHPPPWLTFGG